MSRKVRPIISVQDKRYLFRKGGRENEANGILIILVCFILAGFRVAFSQEQKEQKGEYQKRIEAKLNEFKQKLEELKGKAGELKEDAKKEFNQEMKELQKKEEAANKKLKELKSTSAKTWEKIKADMDKELSELDKQYDKMMCRFKKT
jgi:DNA anti-recombination protein RmuC